MPLAITLSQTQSLSAMVRSAELVLALDRAGGHDQTQLLCAQDGGVWRHLMGAACQQHLRRLETTSPPPAAAHRLWLGPQAQAPQNLPHGTWCLGTNYTGDARRMMAGHATLPMWLVHPYASSAAQLGGTRHTSIPLSLGTTMRSSATQAPSGICVIGSGTPEFDRVCVALVARRTAGDILFFDPYQHHLAHGLPHVKRIVAPCGPSRRSMLYASCRYVVAAAPSLGVDDHFVCEAVAMGLMPLAAFAPVTMAPTDLWESHAMTEAFSAAVAHRGQMPKTSYTSPLAQAVSVYQPMRRIAQARPWGTGGVLGVVQSLRPEDVAAVHHLDGRALIVMCGREPDLGEAIRAWLLRCDYRSVCMAGVLDGACAPFLIQALKDAADTRAQLTPMRIARAPHDTALMAWICQQRAKMPNVQFDIVHLGASAADVLHIRGLIALLEQSQQTHASDASQTETPALTVMVCARGAPEPLWITPWRHRWPHTCVVLHDAPGTASDDTHALDDATTRAQLHTLLSTDMAARVIDVGGGGAWLEAACRDSGRARPCRWHAQNESLRRIYAVDSASFAELHHGAARAACGLAPDAFIVLLAAPHLDAAACQALAPLWPIASALRRSQPCVLFVLLAPDAQAAAYDAVEQELDRLQLRDAVMLVRSLGDPFAAAPKTTPLDAHPMWWGAADIYVDGPWACASHPRARACAMAAGLAVIAWPTERVLSPDADAAGIAFSVDLGPEDAMAASLHTYLQTLCIDAPLRARLGERARHAAAPCLQWGPRLEALLAQAAPSTPVDDVPPVSSSSSFAVIAARMRGARESTR